jgi:predicted TIM-barrel fold metal-dependent hydrolase
VEDNGGAVELLDAHHHLLNLAELDYPWIGTRSPALLALLENYYDIAHDYGPAAYRADVAGVGIGQSVACEYGAADPVAEAVWIQRCADSGAGPDGFVAGVDLASASVGEVLARYRDLPVVRAVRQPLYWAADPVRRLGARPDFLTDPRWLRGFERVAAVGLAWDLLVYDEQLPQAHELIRSFPQTPIVLEAAGWPLDRSADGFRRWAEQLEAVSDFPNVTLKLQGLALLFGPSRAAVERWVRHAVAVFGPARCLFATHLPVDRLLWSAAALVETLRAILGDLPADEQREFFGGCARRVYGVS